MENKAAAPVAVDAKTTTSTNKKSKEKDQSAKITSKEEALQLLNADGDVTRDDVKAQREAKRLAKADKKAAVRAKEKSKPQQTTDKPEVKNNKNNENSSSTKKLEAEAKTKVQQQQDKKAEKVMEKPKKEQQQQPKKEPTIKTDINKKSNEKQPLAANNKAISTPAVAPSTIAKKKITARESKVQTLFDHMPRAQPPENIFTDDVSKLQNIHSEFYSIGLKYAQGMDGSNKRCLALLTALKTFVKDYKLPKEKQFKFSFIQELNLNLDFLRTCRPFTIAMDNIVESFKAVIREIDSEEDEANIKYNLKQHIIEFEERVSKAKEAIISKGQDKISEGDTILVYGSSDILGEIIIAAIKRIKSEEKNLSIIVVDSRPFTNEKKERSLYWIKKIGDLEDVNVTYVGITGLSNYIRGVTKVFLRAHALLNNGSVLGYAGTSQIALLAHYYNIPVLVCCETYKFCDLSPTDSFFLNELGYGFGINNKLVSEENSPYLKTPVIKYDITPANLCTAVITDVDILPTTSVPAVLRVQETRSFRV